MRSAPFYFLLVSVFHFSIDISAQSNILIDGKFGDWQGIPPLHSDSLGDGGPTGIDFKDLWMSGDSSYLNFMLDLGTEINLQSGNDIVLYLDCDNDPQTGQSKDGIGADLIYEFGNRTGSVFISGNTLPINHFDLGLYSSPTVTSDTFEFSFRKSLTFLGQPLFKSDTLLLIIEDLSSGGDKIPDQAGGILYNTQTDSLQSVFPDYSIVQKDPNTLRICSYNVLNDGLFDSQREPSFQRILQALDPDIIGFQEIYNHTSSQVSNKIESILPSSSGEQWYHSKQGPDIITISRYPINFSIAIDGNGAFVIDLPGAGNEMLLINAHTPCCSNDAGRQQEVDAMMAFVRDSKNGSSSYPLIQNSPIVILGDMNLVGLNQQLKTLLNGDIVNNGLYGPDFLPDWDSTSLVDANPYSTGQPRNFSWYNESSSFGPGRLDFIIYSGSVMELKNTYALFTPDLANDTLSFYGLQNDDSKIAADHIPLISDFTIPAPVGFQPQNLDEIEFKLIPNPANNISLLEFNDQGIKEYSLALRNSNGKDIWDRALIHTDKGINRIPINLKGLPAGIYFLEISAESFSKTRKLILLD